MKAVKKLAKARTALVLSQPFWASLALQVPLTPDPTCKTGWTDGTKIAYNPDYIESLDESTVISFVGHEVGHPAFLHHLRENGRDHGKWNQACDFAINLILKDSGFDIPQNWLCDDKYRGMSAEEIYRVLPDTSKEGNPDPDDEGDGQGNPEGDDISDESKNNEMEDNSQMDNQDYGPGEVRPCPGNQNKEPSPSERRQEEIAWKTKVSQAAEIAKAQGDLPEGLERLVKDLITPKINWRTVLASYVTEAMDQDYSWSRPNTRYAHGGLYLPSLVEQDGGNILVIIDTSGSVSESDMTELASECQGIIAAYQIELDVLYVDTNVQGHQTFTSADLPLKLEPKGGGGTDFRPGFDWIKHQGKFPQCSIYLTDGWCSSFPDNPPDYPVLWVLGGDYPCKNFMPPFGEVIRMVT